MIQRDILLDVTRLVWRVWAGRLPTGIDRVCLAYLDHYGPRARAVVQRGRLRLVLNLRHSRELFALLRKGGPGFKRRLILLLAAARMTSWKAQAARGSIYLNIGHTGLDAPGLAGWTASGLAPPHQTRNCGTRSSACCTTAAWFAEAWRVLRPRRSLSAIALHGC